MTLNFVRRTMSIRASVMLAAETEERSRHVRTRRPGHRRRQPRPAPHRGCRTRVRTGRDPGRRRRPSCWAAQRPSWPAVWPASAWRPHSRPRSATTCTAASSATPCPSAGSTCGGSATDPSVPTGLSVVLSVGDRAILTHPGTIATDRSRSGRRGPADRRPARPQRVVLPAAAPGPAPSAAPRPGPRRPAPPRPWTPTSTRPGTWRGVHPLLGHTDVLMPNSRSGAARPRRPSSTATRRQRRPGPRLPRSR